ncbi:methyl-accepting chemotaxis protein [Peribacillus kribbensis]|uniref:methyl-accepting chemotaxis protein n=1 Tax=Peribacillus kribbensis TaxID=356658 RepID=UPI000400A0AA|nr:methyl-accepting chemotaxis protein [Peribacillus kribbensis]
MKISIGKKLLSGFGIIILLVIALATISFTQFSSVNSSYSTLIGEQVKKAMYTKDLKYLATEESRSTRGFLLTGDSAHLDKFDQAKNDYQTTTDALGKMLYTPKGIQQHKELNQAHQQYVQVMEQVIQLKKENKVQESLQLLLDKGTPLSNQFTQKAKELEKSIQALLDSETQKTQTQVAHVKNTILIVSILSVILGLVIATFISRMISRPVTAVANAAKEIADGNLTQEDIHVKNKDEIGDLSESFNYMKKSLQSLISKVGQSSDLVAAASEELYASSEQSTNAANQVAESVSDISNSTESQMNSMEENKVAMEENAIGLQRIAESTSTVSETANEVLREAEQGSKVINQSVVQMDGINKSVKETAVVIESLGENSKQIGQIVEVISDIANQTNLLALNAAIEAARAGEHGKGFAVVADEVRKLAEQSKNSSEQIGSLIQGIQQNTDLAINSMEKGTKEVESGTEIVAKAGEAFNHILTSIERVTGQVQEVSAATEQISASTQQLSASIEQLTSISEGISMNTQEVASASQEQLASMEEISSSAESLSQLAQDLQSEVTRFKI